MRSAIMVVAAVVTVALVVPVALVVVVVSHRTIPSSQKPRFLRFLKRRDGPTDGRTYGRTDGRTDGPTDKPSYRDAMTHLKREELKKVRMRLLKENKLTKKFVNAPHLLLISVLLLSV